MNLLYKEYLKHKFNEMLEEEKLTYFKYRNFEYEKKLYDIIDATINYIKENTNIKFDCTYSLESETSNVNFLRSDVLKLTFDYYLRYKNKEIKDKYVILIPKLVYNHFFFLRGNLYVPTIKLKQYYTNYGKERIIIRSLFTGLVIDHGGKIPFKEDHSKYVVSCFTGKKMPFEIFIYELFKNDKDFLEEISEYYKYDFTKKKKHTKASRQFISHLSNVFDKTGERNLDEILSNMILDKFSKHALETEVGFEIDRISKLVKFLFRKAFKLPKDYVDKEKDLADLKNRRFVFIEDILNKFFLNIFMFLIKLSTGHENIKMKVKPEVLITDFVVNGKYLYDRAAVYSSVQSCISVQMDGGDVRKYMRRLHPSYFRRICCISTSSSSPGETVHVNPNLELTYHGYIKDLFVPLSKREVK